MAEQFFNEHKIRVDFAPHIKKWVDGIVHGRVASEHKGPHELDQNPTQWATNGQPMAFDDVLPKKWRQQGFVRKVKMTNHSFLDVCREHHIRTEEQTWALATDMEEKGDKALMTFLMENGVGILLDRPVKAMDAKETLRRSKMTRLEILQEYADTKACTCPTPGACYVMLKDALAKNNVDGPFQKKIVAILRTGRAKMMNLCVVGGSNMAKSFVLKPLFVVFKAYTRPEGGNYQLEKLIGKEMVFLNDFEYDDSAKKWAPWQYLKNLLEGEFVEVARPKNRGGDTEFKSDAPVFMTAPQEVALHHGKKRDDYETTQMSNRIYYIRSTHEFKKDPDAPELKPCGHCGARVYLEGLSPTTVGASAAGGGAPRASDAPGGSPGSARGTSPATSARAYLEDVCARLGLSSAPGSGAVSADRASSLSTTPLKSCKR